VPEYLAPGVFVEETSFRSKSIEGVGTSTTGFVGPTRKGPPGGSVQPELLTSFGDFERIYGGLGDLNFTGGAAINYLAHAVRAYFNEGGARLYVSRAVGANTAKAKIDLVPNAQADEQISLVARFAGKAGDGRITLREVAAPATLRSMETAQPGTLLRAHANGGGNPTFYVKRDGNWFDNNAAPNALNAQGTNPNTPPPNGGDLLFVTVLAEDADGQIVSYENLAYDRLHPFFIGTVMTETPTSRADHLNNLFAIRIESKVDAFELRTTLAGAGAAVTLPDGSAAREIRLTGGGDGAAPNFSAYETCLNDLTALEDISTVAAPGYSAHPISSEVAAIQNALITHADKRGGYRVAVLDSIRNQGVTEVRAQKSQIDSTHAALYFPWVVVANPLARPGLDNAPREISLPPSGFVCGIYARNDIERGVFKAPANEVVRSAVRFEVNVNFAQQEVLNPLGVNCLRFLSGRGYRVWGARTISSDPEWKYVNVRRYFNYLEASIDRGTQWAVFEPNGERLWANIRETVSAFLLNEFVSGALLGKTAEEAFFVRCDRSTMTQNDLDNGRLICLVGVAALKPAEFVIFRIGQKTADARS
jgi:uncharacterized protein